MYSRATSAIPQLQVQVSGEGPHNIVCIHELGGSMESFAPLLAGLETQCRVLRYDQRGQGRSLQPGLEDYSMSQQADDLAQVLADAEFAGPYWLLGVAAGAAIAVTFAARYAGDPDKVAGLILCSPALSMAPDRAENLRRRAAIAVELGMPAIVDETLARSWPQQLRDNNEHDTDIARRFEAYRSRLANADARGYAAANRALANYSASADLPELKCPVTLIAGLYDQVRPPSVVAALREYLPNARYVELPGAHLLPQQVPQALLAEIETCLNHAPGGTL
jgi:3-oxoadipate enol-lactonase